ncbi:MAG: tripartite tricarboxylate transporter permease [Acetobacterales bacterium]
MFEPLIHSFWVTIQPDVMLAITGGVILGILFGAMPGLTATMAIALLIPLTFGMQPLVALGMLAGVHNGASYGGAIPAVLLRIPGTPGAICTTFDGYPMSKQGLARTALWIAVVSSAVGGMVSAISLMLLSPPLARVTLAFGPPEIFWVNVFGLASIAVLLGDDPVKGLLASLFGLLLGCVGIDMVTGHERFTFDILYLVSGLPLLIVLVGLYAMPPAWEMAEEANLTGVTQKDLEFKDSRGIDLPLGELLATWARSCVIGIIIGILPGVGGTAGGFIAYNEVRRASRDPDSFGKGNPMGVACAESANNADNAAAMIPALTLGVPGSGLAALMLGALLIHGLQPGPQLFREAPDIVFGYMWAMFISSGLLIVFGGMMATRLFAQILRLPQVLLMPLIIAITVIGAYTFQNSFFDVYMMLLFGFVGFLMERLKFPIAPTILGLVLGDKAEFNMRTSLLMGQGDPAILFTRPISQAVIVLVVLVLLYPVWRWWQEKRRGRAGEDFRHEPPLGGE